MVGIKVGDRVRYAGRGCSVLDYAPGIVVEAGVEIVRVEVVKGGTVCGNLIRAGERFVFQQDRLRVVHCQHQDFEDCLVCAKCGDCREDLDADDTCIPCGGRPNDDRLALTVGVEF